MATTSAYGPSSARERCHDQARDAEAAGEAIRRLIDQLGAVAGAPDQARPS